MSNDPKAQPCLRVVGARVGGTVPEADRGDVPDYMTRAGAAALVLGGTVAIVSGPADQVETVVSYTLNMPRVLRA